MYYIARTSYTFLPYFAIPTPFFSFPMFFLLVLSGLAEDETVCKDDLLLDCEVLLQAVIVVSDSLPEQDGDQLVTAIADVYNWLDMKRIDRHCHRGRPRIDIPECQLSLLLSFQFTCVDISRMLQVSPSTVRRRICQFGLEDAAAFTEMSESDLDTITREFVHNNPCGGQTT